MEKAAPTVIIQITLAEREPYAGGYHRRRYRPFLSQSVPGGLAAMRMVQPSAHRQRKVEESVTFIGSWPR